MYALIDAALSRARTVMMVFVLVMLVGLSVLGSNVNYEDSTA